MDLKHQKQQDEFQTRMLRHPTLGIPSAYPLQKGPEGCWRRVRPADYRHLHGQHLPCVGGYGFWACHILSTIGDMNTRGNNVESYPKRPTRMGSSWLRMCIPSVKRLKIKGQSLVAYGRFLQTSSFEAGRFWSLTSLSSNIVLLCVV